jgi:hypothetical protein
MLAALAFVWTVTPACDAQSLYVMPGPSPLWDAQQVQMSKDGRTLVRLSEAYSSMAYQTVLEFGSLGEPVRRVEVPRPTLQNGVDKSRLAGVSRDGRRASFAVDETYSGQMEVRNVGRDGSNEFLYRNVPWTDENLERIFVAESGRDFAYEFLHPRGPTGVSFINRSDGVNRRITPNRFGEVTNVMGISADGSHVIGSNFQYGPDIDHPVWTAPVLYRDSDRSLTFLPVKDDISWGYAKSITPDARYVFGSIVSTSSRYGMATRWDTSLREPVMTSMLMDADVIDSSDAGSVALVGRYGGIGDFGFLLWNVETGSTVNVLDAMRDSGLALPATWTEVRFHGLSGDGLSIFGMAKEGSVYRSFIATIPSPGVMGIAAGVLGFAGVRRRRWAGRASRRGVVALAGACVASSVCTAQSLFIVPPTPSPIPVSRDFSMSKDGRTLAFLSETTLTTWSVGGSVRSRNIQVDGKHVTRIAGMARDGSWVGVGNDDTGDGSFRLRRIAPDGTEAIVYNAPPFGSPNIESMVLAENGRDFSYYYKVPMSPDSFSFISRDGNAPSLLPRTDFLALKPLAANPDRSILVGGHNAYDKGSGFLEVPALYRDGSGSMTFLPTLPTSREGQAIAISRGSSSVLGLLYGSSDLSAYVRWDISSGVPVIDSTAMSARLYGSFQGADDSGSLALVEDGEMLWRVGVGLTPTTDALRSAGVVFPSSWTSLRFLEISGDGQSVAGQAIDGSGARQWFIATIPTPGAVGVALGTMVAGHRRRRSPCLAISPKHHRMPAGCTASRMRAMRN